MDVDPLEPADGGPDSGDALFKPTSSESSSNESSSVSALSVAASAPVPGDADLAGSGADAGDAEAVDRLEQAAPGSRIKERSGEFTISQLFLKGEHIGFEIVCGCHLNHGEGPAVKCKKHLTFGQAGMSPAEVVHRLKVWVYKGLEIDGEHPEARKKHMAINPRTLPLPLRPSVAELDAMFS